MAQCSIPKYTEKYYPCVYQIRNIINNKVYIGSTYRFNRRKRLHLYTLNKNIHKNIILQRAWNKYGKENFVFEILEYINFGQIFCKKEIKSVLLEKEQLYLNKLDKSNFYNIRKLADSNLGTKLRPMSEQHKIKIGEANKKLTESQIIEIFTLAKLGKTQKYIAEKFEMNPSQICRILNGKKGYNKYFIKLGYINKNKKPTLKKEVILEIYYKLRQGLSSNQLQKEYEVDQSTISRINTKSRQYTWLHNVK